MQYKISMPIFNAEVKLSSSKSSSEFINFLFNTQEKSSDNKNTDKTSIEDSIEQERKQSNTMDYKAVWLSYLEFNSYRKSVKNNNLNTIYFIKIYVFDYIIAEIYNEGKYMGGRIRQPSCPCETCQYRKQELRQSARSQYASLQDLQSDRLPS